MEANQDDGSDILIWCRRLPKWEIVFGPFPVSLVEDLIKQARISQKEEGGVGIAPLPGTQCGESGTYISANGNTAKYRVETRGSLKLGESIAGARADSPCKDRLAWSRIGTSCGSPW